MASKSAAASKAEPAKADANRPLGVAIVGCGYWGPNLIRNFMACPTTTIVMLCDRDPERLQKCAPNAPKAKLVSEIDEVLASPEVDAVAIATPAATHHRS